MKCIHGVDDGAYCAPCGFLGYRMMPSEPAFKEFPKIYRYSRECIVTEKIDGTNALVFISDDLSTVKAGSRNGWTEDNFGWALWVEKNKEELKGLGPGYHYGEWWGSGIQRGYGLSKGEKRFSLFNVSRWSDDMRHLENNQSNVRPRCCGVVPILWFGPFDMLQGLALVMADLSRSGSIAAPGFDRPEGVVVFHVPSHFMFKKTFQKDDEPKGGVR